ncbi:PP2C family protein-serine/threonine phosphatase [Streptomyces sp. RerS4]|uniref:PP2C family protein-serine/threonine phosphatase n=1 Tax=Streptomyces sp. RerS4 TaxID=2942449 RepID=UPI00201C51BD|nr:PP2C family protein-serine/threonine phosphatase [Streptomyces sp. RerS4]UQX00236.1 PP2C family protein-serine/threonine phosphatase [Streptomyces sp. RerS4]
MPSTTVIILDEYPPPPPELLDALRAMDAELVPRTLRELRDGPQEALPVADVLLAPAESDGEAVRAAVRRLRRRFGGTVVTVWTVSDFVALERHVRLGHDYLVPPFLPALVGARLLSCSERAGLGRTLREADARAELTAYEKELEIGREIQAGFLPESLPVPAGWEIDVRFRPARQVAGDFYDVFELSRGRRLAVVVADVCDKGVGAALFMALIRSLLRHTAENSGLQHLMASARAGAGRRTPVVGATPLLNAVTATNGYLTRNHLRQGYFATLFFGVLDPLTGSLVYINGGHNPPLLLSGDGARPRPLDVTGPAVGVLPDCVYTLGYAQVNPGDTLFVFTDGVPEARCPDGDFLGDERMLELLGGPPASGRDLVDRMDRAVREHTGIAEQHDDVTMLALHRPRAARGPHADSAGYRVVA